MSFFSDLSGTKRMESVVCIDIGAESVAGAYVVYAEGEQPIVLYAQRFPIRRRDNEPHERAMLHMLDTLGNTLIKEGAPILMRHTGKGSVTTVLVSVDAPWQKTTVRTEYFEQKESFIFSKSLVKAALEKTSVVPPGQLLADESVIGTILNGYKTRDPYGKEVNRASIIILTSLIDERVAGKINGAFRSLYHTKNIVSIAGSSIRYQAMRIAFPHEKDALILDATGAIITIALVRRDLLADVVEVPSNTADTAAWLQKIKGVFAELAGRFPLPRTIFLLAHEPEMASVRESLDTANLKKLWLSDNPPKILSVLGSHITGLMWQAPTAQLDLSLLLMALFYHTRGSGVDK